MNSLRGWTLRLAMMVAVLAIPALAAAGGCGYPPDNSGTWYFVDDVIMDLRMVARGPTGYGTWSTADQETNYTSSTKKGVTLRWRGYSKIQYSVSLKSAGIGSNQSEQEIIEVTVDIPPMYEAALKIRDAVRSDTYTFSTGCLWFDGKTRTYRTLVAATNLKGTISYSWHDSTVSMRTVY